MLTPWVENGMSKYEYSDFAGEYRKHVDEAAGLHGTYEFVNM